MQVLNRRTALRDHALRVKVGDGAGSLRITLKQHGHLLAARTTRLTVLMPRRNISFPLSARQRSIFRSNGHTRLQLVVTRSGPPIATRTVTFVL